MGIQAPWPGQVPVPGTRDLKLLQLGLGNGVDAHLGELAFLFKLRRNGYDVCYM